MTDGRVRWGATLLRVATSSVFVIHGIARVSLGGVAPFGQFLAGSGLPAGHAIAWTLTLVEIVGGTALVLGFAVRPLAAWFAAQIAVGIVMVHGKAGWFVVGVGRNGAEYSAFILACLLTVVLTDAVAHRLAPGRRASRG